MTRRLRASRQPRQWFGMVKVVMGKMHRKWAVTVVGRCCCDDGTDEVGKSEGKRRPAPMVALRGVWVLRRRHSNMLVHLRK